MPSGMPNTTAMTGGEGELERRRHALQDELERRLAEHERVAEVAAQRVAEESGSTARALAGRGRAAG
jgi:hypothetical protein